MNQKSGTPDYSGRLRSRSGWRSKSASSVMAEMVPHLSLASPALVIDDTTGNVREAFSEIGVEVVEWHRFAIQNRSASAWPGEGACRTAVLRLPTSRESLEMTLHAIASRTVPGARILVYGTNDEGIRSAVRPVEALFGQVETLAVKRRSRVLGAVRPEKVPAIRQPLSSWQSELDMELPEGRFKWVSYPGVFAHGKVDEGTRMLIDALPVPDEKARILDYGCGMGPVGAIMRHRAPQAQIDMLDIYAPAVEASRQNVAGANVILGDGFAALAGRGYDIIASNPPIHSGVGEDFRIVRDLTEGSPSHLLPGGELWLVTQRTVPVGRLLDGVFTSVERVAENTRFQVFRAKR